MERLGDMLEEQQGGQCGLRGMNEEEGNWRWGEAGSQIMLDLVGQGKDLANP